MLDLLYSTIIWVIGPISILMPLFRCFAIIYCIDDLQIKRSAESGVGAGFTLFVAYVYATRVFATVSN
jgi:hypothetical protein